MAEVTSRDLALLCSKSVKKCLTAGFDNAPIPRDTIKRRESNNPFTSRF